MTDRIDMTADIYVEVSHVMYTDIFSFALLPPSLAIHQQTVTLTFLPLGDPPCELKHFCKIKPLPVFLPQTEARDLLPQTEPQGHRSRRPGRACLSSLSSPTPVGVVLCSPLDSPKDAATMARRPQSTSHAAKARRLGEVPRAEQPWCGAQVDARERKRKELQGSGQLRDSCHAQLRKRKGL
jgi:hypothetical protein